METVHGAAKTDDDSVRAGEKVSAERSVSVDVEDIDVSVKSRNVTVKSTGDSDPQPVHNAKQDETRAKAPVKSPKAPFRYDIHVNSTLFRHRPYANIHNAS
jgi:hypothetical protein